MTITESMLNLKYLADNSDQCMVWCKECDTPTVDTGKDVITCKDCDAVLIYRPPVEEVCPYCMRKVPLIHACRVKGYE